MQIKQWLYIILFTLVSSACSDNNAKKYVIGVSQCSEDIWRDKLNNELVMSTYQHDNVKLKFASANDNDKLQKQQIDQFIKERVNLLIVSPNQIHTISSVIDKAYDAGIPVSVVLVIDATTGQNGLNQAKEFNDALSLDGLIVTKLDGTAKGGIALAISNQLNLPIYRIGVGESIDDLQTFDARSFCEALVGEGVQ